MAEAADSLKMFRTGLLPLRDNNESDKISFLKHLLRASSCTDSRLGFMWIILSICHGNLRGKYNLYSYLTDKETVALCTSSPQNLRVQERALPGGSKGRGGSSAVPRHRPVTTQTLILFSSKQTHHHMIQSSQEPRYVINSVIIL